jgi:hypothetical protein
MGQGALLTMRDKNILEETTLIASFWISLWSLKVSLSQFSPQFITD